MDTVVALAKRRGFVFPGSSIYGGLANAWDYGPMGVLLKNNIRQAWWRDYVLTRSDIVGLDSAILMNPAIWKASGHVNSFTDPLIECKSCHERFRADKVAGKCPACGGVFTEARQFNLMFKTFLGPVEDTASTVYLRPETAQGIFTNFKNVLDTTRIKVPFGIAQVGKAFRNEITPGNFLFRTREFEQMEIEWFVEPPSVVEVKSQKLKVKSRTPDEWFEYWKTERLNWYLKYGIKKENLRPRAHDKTELAHYAAEALDIEYNFPFGWSELEGIANRTDFDLKQHAAASGQDLTYFDDRLDQKYLPHVIEPSAGLDRSLLAFFIDAYHEEEAPTATGGTEKRVVLQLHPDLAPVKVAVLPLLKNNEALVSKARSVFELVKNEFAPVAYDEAGAIGRRYRRQDEIGTPSAITIDHTTLEDDTVTIRNRDTMQQIRVKTSEIAHTLKQTIHEFGAGR